MHAQKGFNQNLIRHSFDDVTFRARFEGAVDVFVPFIGSEDDKARHGKSGPDRENGIHSAHFGQPQVHQSHVGSMLRK